MNDDHETHDDDSDDRPAESTADLARTGADVLRQGRAFLRRSRGVAAALAAIVVAFWLGTGIGPDRSSRSPDPPTTTQAEDTAFWTCAMHPQIRVDESGQCPICGMDLVAGTRTDANEHAGQSPRVTLSEHAKALARIKTTRVGRTEARGEIRLLGHVDYDETRLRTITPWTAGRIDRLHVRVTGTKVKRGQSIATLYSPEVYAALRDVVVAARQAEALASGKHGSGALARQALESARERVRLLGVPDSTINRVVKTKEAPTKVTIRSSVAGTILERLVEEGDYVQVGMPLYNVADLSNVWIQIEAYESDLPHLSAGQDVLVEVQSLPGETLRGKIAFIDPVLDNSTRTARVRVEVDNDGRLRPGMFAAAVIEIGAAESLAQMVIPATAPLFTGRRSVVYVEAPGHDRPTYELRVVRLGARAGPVYPVLSGLSEGERVVTEGAFVIDADLQLAGGRSMMTLADDERSALGAVPNVSLEFRASLAPVVTRYLDAGRQLAADDLDAARKSLEELATVVNKLELTGPRAALEAWQPVASQLSGHARQAAQTSAEGELRSAYERVSLSVIFLLRRFGNPMDAPLKLAFCPMAFDSRGAQWVQDDTAIANPYYGAAMLRCGDAHATVLPGEALAVAVETKPPAAPAGHKH